MKSFKLLIVLLFVCFFKTNAQENYPILKEIVTDNASIFSAEELIYLKQKLTEYENRTTHQIVVLTINNLGNDTVENHAFQTFNADGNKFGQKEKDNGILILVAKNDRKFKIEVGDGLTPIITDLISSRIQRQFIIPAFKQGYYFKGIDEATSEMIKIIDNPKYIDEFTNDQEETSKEVSIITKFFSSIFLTFFFLTLGYFVYNKLIFKNNKAKKINVKKLYNNNKTKFIIILFLAISVVMYFNAFLWYAFFGVFIVGFLSIFVGIGLFVILKAAHKKLKNIFVSLFSGKLGVVLFPFYLPGFFFLFIAGLAFTIAPIFMGFMFVIQFIGSTDINTFMSELEPLYFLFLVICCVLLFFIITIISAYRTIKNSLKKTFGFSFFKFDGTLSSGFGSGSSRGYSSSGSSNYSSYSSSSSSSFSGGGGSSSGGGSSGSW